MSVALIALFPGAALLAAPLDPPDLRQTPIVQVVAKVKEAVATIRVQNPPAQTAAAPPEGRTAGSGKSGRGRRSAAALPAFATAFCITPDGYLVTSERVVARATSISVELDDGRSFAGKLVGSDSAADLALLKIDAPNTLPTVPLGNSDALIMGEPLVLIGDAYDLPGTISTGVVSALHRNRGARRDLLQTDAAINPGNTGGPLFNLSGQVIGIAADSASDAQAIGFATPVNRLRDLLPTLMDPAKIRATDVGFRLAERRTAGPGDRIDTKIVLADNTARVVAAINGKPVHDLVEACGIMLSLKPGDAVKLDFADGTTQAAVARSKAPSK
jgi:serine protease Do